MSKRILLLGATGRTGSFALDYALSKGWQIIALVRRPEAITARSENLTVIQGSPLNSADMFKVIPGCDAVVSFLNNNRTSDMPWAKPVSPPNFMADSVRNAVQAMKAHGIRRIAVLSATGAGDSFVHAPFLIRWMVKNTNLGHTYRDHDAQEAVLTASGLDWTAVRAVRLCNSYKPKSLVMSYENSPKPAMMISRDSVARFLIDCLDQPEFVGKAPVISEE